MAERLCVPDQDSSDLDDWPEVLRPDHSQVESGAGKRRKPWWKNIMVETPVKASVGPLWLLV